MGPGADKSAGPEEQKKVFASLNDLFSLDIWMKSKKKNKRSTCFVVIVLLLLKISKNAER